MSYFVQMLRSFSNSDINLFHLKILKSVLKNISWEEIFAWFPYSVINLTNPAV